MIQEVILCNFFEVISYFICTFAPEKIVNS